MTLAEHVAHLITGYVIMTWYLFKPRDKLLYLIIFEKCSRPTVDNEDGNVQVS